MLNATICIFYAFAFMFLTSIFDLRRYNDAYVPGTMKFTTFIDELVGKNINLF